MKKIVLLLAAMCSIAVLDADAARKKAKHVLLIGIDGMSSEGIHKAAPEDIPNLTYLMENGSWTLSKRSVMPSESAMNWASIFNGLPTEMHGFDKWNATRSTIPSTSDNGHGIPPTVFTLLRQQRPACVTGIVYDWDGIGVVTDTLAADFHRYFKTYRGKDILMTTEAYTRVGVDYIKEKKPDFFTFYYGLLDHTGHSFGWCSPEYMACQKDLDHGIGILIQGLKDAGIFEDTLIIVTSDHGGVNKDHGKFTLQELEPPFIVFGKRVKKGFAFPEPMIQYDTAATIAYILGLDIPGDWRGKPMVQIFK